MFFFLFAGLACLAGPARADSISAAFDGAIAQFEAARPGLDDEVAGVSVAAYRDALTLRRFTSPFWGRELRLVVRSAPDNGGACGRFAAHVLLPPSEDSVTLTLCPQFREGGTEALRRLTILHELVHVVAGPDECRAMEFAARVEFAATGSFTPVDAYWQANGCAGSAFSLP